MTTAIPRVLASTTSHKREPLLPTLEVFGRLGLTDIDVNLHHIIEVGLPIDDIRAACHTHGLRVWVVSGGWCDFFHRAPEIDKTMASIARQVEIAGAFGVTMLRLFFGRLHLEHYNAGARAAIVGNLHRLSDAHPHMRFVFENHDGASLRPEVCFEVIQEVARPNIRMNFDPINFAKAGVDPLAALRVCQPVVSHVHLKGLERGEYCEFAEGDVDLMPTLEMLMRGGYAGQFSVEYEGHQDPSLRLYRSVGRARQVIAGLV